MYIHLSDAFIQCNLKHRERLQCMHYLLIHFWMNHMGGALHIVTWINLTFYSESVQTSPNKDNHQAPLAKHLCTMWYTNIKRQFWQYVHWYKYADIVNPGGRSSSSKCDHNHRLFVIGWGQFRCVPVHQSPRAATAALAMPDINQPHSVIFIIKSNKIVQMLWQRLLDQVLGAFHYCLFLFLISLCVACLLEDCPWNWTTTLCAFLPRQGIQALWLSWSIQATGVA